MLSALVAAAPSLAAGRWDKRVVLIFGPGDSEDAQKQGRVLLGQGAGLAERDMLVIGVVGDSASVLFGEAAQPPDGDRLRADYGVSPAEPLTVILVGKDGGEKLRRQGEVVAPDELFRLIDSMPMRQSEMGK